MLDVPTVFPVMVLFSTVRVPKFSTPPLPKLAEFLDMVLLSTVRVPEFTTPPPTKAKFPEMALFSTVRVPLPKFARPPPKPPTYWAPVPFSEIVLFSTVRVPLPKFATPVLLLVLFLFAVRLDVDAWQSIHNSGRPFGRFDAAIAWLDARAKIGDRVYESNWDLFPELFYGSDRVHMVSGLDPTFLYKQNPELSDAYVQLVQGQATSTAYHVVHDLAGASYVFVDRKAGARFDEVIRADSRFEQGFSDDVATVYIVR